MPLLVAVVAFDVLVYDTISAGNWPCRGGRVLNESDAGLVSVMMVGVGKIALRQQQRTTNTTDDHNTPSGFFQNPRANKVESKLI